MLLIGRFPTYGYYALMFAAVLQNVVKVNRPNKMPFRKFYQVIFFSGSPYIRMSCNWFCSKLLNSISQLRAIYKPLAGVSENNGNDDGGVRIR